MPFAAPKVSVGSTVLFVSEPGANGVPAVVLKMGSGGRVIDLLILGGRNLSLKGGLRHEDDPFESMQAPEGFWRLNDGEKDLRSRLAFLESAVAGLKKK